MAKEKINILVVEDMRQLVDLHQRWIKMVGWECRCFLTGTDALAAFNNQNDFDVIILDMVLPDISGAELFDQLRAINPEIPVIVCSGYSEEMNQMIDKKKISIVSKPFNIMSLRDEVVALVEDAPCN